MNGRKKFDAKGNNGIRNLKNPYPPSFKRILAKITDPIVGASTCASGSHKWNGAIGIFVAKVKKRQIHKAFCSFGVKL